LGIAVSVSLVAALTDQHLGSGGSGLPAAVAVTAALSGVIAYVWRQNHRDLPANIPENNRRREERHATNDAIQRRNADRIAQTVLVITPASGLGQ
jgi:hypothetical protein